MPYADLDLDQLRQHRTASTPASDLDVFWSQTLASSRASAVPPEFTMYDNGLRTIASYDVRFSGFDGQRIAGWLHLPAGADSALPCIVEYVGYGGGRGLAHERTVWASAGFAHLVMDTRGQGAAWSIGVTPDDAPGTPAVPGVMTRGIADPSTYYYRRLITDAVLAVDAAREHPLVDPSALVVAGGSQGGGLSIAVAGLRDDLAGAMPDVPFLCDIERAIWICDEEPYTEISTYLSVHRDQIAATLRTLSYVDGAHLAARANTPTLFSVALMDPVCPPSTVYAAYNAWAGPKQIREYAYNGHNGGAGFQFMEQVRWVRELLG